MKASTLELFRLERVVLPGEPKKHLAFWDFTVNGLSFYREFGIKRDLVSAIWVDPPVMEENKKAIKRLLKLEPADFPSDRVAIYVCPECGDLGCGAISVEIIFSRDYVTWKSFGYQNNYEDAIETDCYSSVGPFVFDRICYEALFQKLLREA